MAWSPRGELRTIVAGRVSCALLLAALGMWGCKSDDAEVPCQLNSECPDGQICTDGVCHEECRVTRDCANGQRCVQGEASTHCQSREEAVCQLDSQCAMPLVCAVDLQCRNSCSSDKDCLSGQVCAVEWCAEPAEIDDSGELITADP